MSNQQTWAGIPEHVAITINGKQVSLSNFRLHISLATSAQLVKDAPYEQLDVCGTASRHAWSCGREAQIVWESQDAAITEMQHRKHPASLML
jgi:hypothetical protein